MSNVLLCITGSIAVYKICDLVSELKKLNHNVTVVMSKNATKFVAPLTFQVLSRNIVYTDIFQETDSSKILHIDLPKETDIIVLAPATANIISKIVHGVADDMISCILLANPNKPVLIAPAMNNIMYSNPVVQENIITLKNKSFIIIEPRTALLACNDYGKGALASINDIVTKIEENLDESIGN